MGGSSDSTRDKCEDQVKCELFVDVSDINKVLSDSERKLSDANQKLLRRARRLICEEQKSYFENCEIRVVGGGLDIMFWCGNADNIWFITEYEDRIKDILKRRSRSHYFHDLFDGVCSFISSNKILIIGALAMAGAAAFVWVFGGPIAAKLGLTIGTELAFALGRAVGAGLGCVAVSAVECRLATKNK